MVAALVVPVVLQKKEIVHKLKDGGVCDTQAHGNVEVRAQALRHMVQGGHEKASRRQKDAGLLLRIQALKVVPEP